MDLTGRTLRRTVLAGLTSILLATITYFAITTFLPALAARAGSSASKIPCRYAKDMWGETHDLTKTKWQLFDYLHAAGCGYCVLNGHAYQENFATGLASAGVATYGVDIFENQRDLIDYVKHHRIDYPILTEPHDLWKTCPGIPGQSLFRNGEPMRRLCSTLTRNNYKAFAVCLNESGYSGTLPSYRPLGPLKNALNCVYEDPEAIVVYGDKEPLDPQLHFSGMTRINFQLRHNADLTPDDLETNALLIQGGVLENSFYSRLEGKIPFQIGTDALAFADTVLRGENLRIYLCWPNPWLAEKYLVLKTGTGPSPHDGFIYDGAQDFIISRCNESIDGERQPPRRVASGIFTKSAGRWELNRKDIIWHEKKRTATTSAPRGVTAAPTTTTQSTETITLGTGRFLSLAAATPDSCWAAWDDSRGEIRLSRVSLTGHQTEWTSATTTSRDADAYKPSICASQDGACWITWSELRNGYYQVAAAVLNRDLTMRQWRISTLSNLDHSDPTLTLDENDTPRLSWNCWRANSRQGWSCTSLGEGWSQPERMPDFDRSGFTWYQRGASASGELRYVWMQHYPHPTSIYTATCTGNRWQLPIEISTTGRCPDIAVCGNSNQTWITWQQRTSNLRESVRLNRMIYYSFCAENTWSPPAPIPTCPDGDNAPPVITVDGEGKTYVAWSHKTHLPSNIEPDEGETQTWRLLYTMHDHSGWHGPYLLSDPSLDARSPAITSCGSSVWIGWHQGTGTDTQVALARIDPAMTIHKTAAR
jgi:hypothetical protein